MNHRLAGAGYLGHSVAATGPPEKLVLPNQRSATEFLMLKWRPYQHCMLTVLGRRYIDPAVQGSLSPFQKAGKKCKLLQRK